MQKSTISDGHSLTVDLLDFGARIAAVTFNGHSMALGYENDSDFLTDPYYLGATIGPICNRINNGRLAIGEQFFQMPCNLGGHSLHSGDVGFDKETWTLVKANKNSAHYQLIYPMSRAGLEGRLLVEAIYTVENGSLRIDYHCKTDTTTYINLTNHVYLNIDGSDSIANHQFDIYAENYAEIDQYNIPTGELIPLDVPMKYGIMNSSLPEFLGLCDHHFNTIGGSSEHKDELRTMVVARSTLNNIELDISSNSIGFQFYTGKFLSQPFLPSAGFCVEAQLAPDAINQEHFAAPLLQKGDRRIQSMLFQFKQTG